MSGCPHCPHCQKTKKARALDDITLIKAEDARLLDLILQLQNDHSALRQHRNSLCSATRKLPLEVLSLIFLCTFSPMDIPSRDIRLYHDETYADPRESYVPLRLGAVCTQWLRAAQSTPQLWSSLVLDIYTSRAVEPKTNLLRTYLKNVGNMSFALELNLNWRDILEVDALFDDLEIRNYPLQDLLFKTIIAPENSRRFRVLRLSNPPPKWLSLPFHGFSRLEEFRSGIDSDDPAATRPTAITLRSSHLKRIIVKNSNLSLSPEDRPWSQNVTMINLFRSSVENCFDLLLFCPNLVEFRGRDSYIFDPLDELPQEKDQAFTLSRLEVFEWTFNGDDVWSKAILEHASFPALHTLCWGGHTTGLDQNVLVAFLARLPHNLSALEVVGIREAVEVLGLNLERYSHFLSNVRKLLLYQCSLSFATTIVHGLGLNPNILPSLREISLVKELLPNEDDRDYNPQYESRVLRVRLRSMVFVRWGTQLDRVIFTFGTVDYDLYWDIKDGLWVRAAVQAGMKLDILEDGRPVELLYASYEEGSDSSQRSSVTNSAEE